MIRYTSVPNNKSTANLNLTRNGTFPDAIVVHVTELNDKDNTSVTKLVRYEFETVVNSISDEALLEKTVSIIIVITCFSTSKGGPMIDYNRKSGNRQVILTYCGQSYLCFGFHVCVSNILELVHVCVSRISELSMFK